MSGIRGCDPVITGGSPLFNTENSGRDEVALHLGLNLLGQQGACKGHRLAIEAGAPVYENVDGGYNYGCLEFILPISTFTIIIIG